MRMTKLLLIAVVAFLAAACASNVHQNISQPVESRAEKVENIYLVISNTSSVQTDSNYVQSVDELRNAIREQLQLAMPSASLVSEKVPPTGIKASITIEDFRYVSGAARFLTGIMVGKARLQVRVELIDLATGKKIGESAFGTSSSTSEGIFGGTTSRQLDAVAAKVVVMLRSTAK